MSGPPPVSIKFATEGLDQTLQAIKSIQDALTKSQKQSAAAAKARASSGAKAAKKAAEEEAAAILRSGRMTYAALTAGLANFGTTLKAQLQKQISIREQSATMAGQIAKKSADREIAEAQRAATKKLSLQEKAARAVATVDRQLAVERQRAELDLKKGPARRPEYSAQVRMMQIDSAKGKSPEAKQEILEKARKARQEAQIDRAERKKAEAERKAGERSITAEVERETKKRQRAQEKADRETSAARKQAAAEEVRLREQHAKTVYGGAAKGASAIKTIAGKATNSFLNAGGGFSVDQAIQENLNLERKSAMISVKTGGKLSPKDVERMSRSVSVRTGTDADQVMAGWEAYGDKSGKWDPKDTEKGGLAEFISKYSKVTGVDTKQVGYVAGMLRTQNKHLEGPEMQQMLLDVLAQGREGAVDVPELVSHLPALTKTAGRYTAGSQADNQRKLIALSQIGVATGSVAEVATGLSNMSADTMKHSDKINKLLGREVLDGKGNIAGSPEEFLADMMAASGGSTKKLLDAGVGLRAIKVFDALQPAYKEEEETALKDGKSQKEATAIARGKTLDRLNKPINDTMTIGQLNSDFSTVMQSNAESFEGAVRLLKVEVAEKLIPVLKKLVPLFTKLVQPLSRILSGLVTFADLLAENPIAGFGLVLSGYILKEIAAAKLAEAFGGVATNAAGAATAMGLAAAAIAGAVLLIDHLAKEEDDKQKKSSGTNLELINNRGLLKAGGIQTKEDLAKAEAVKANLEGTIAGNEKNTGGGKLWKGVSMAGAVIRDVATFNPLKGNNGENTAAMAEEQARATARDQKEVDEQKAALAMLTKAMEEAAKKIAAAPEGGGGKGSEGSEKRNQPIVKRGTNK